MPKVPEKQEREPFQQPPIGNHLAVAYAVVDLGTQTIDYKTGKGPETKHQIAIFWELPNELTEDGRPHMTSKEYTLSSNEKSNLMKDLESWRGRAFTEEEYGNFEIANVIGVGCFLNCIEHNGYVKPGSIAALPKDTKAPDLVNDPIRVDLDETFDKSQFDRLSEYWQNKITASPEYAKLANGKPGKITMPDIDETDENESPF